MKYYIIYTDKAKTTILTYGVLENSLSNNHPIDWFDTEAELEKKVDTIMGAEYYQSQKTEDE